MSKNSSPIKLLLIFVFFLSTQNYYHQNVNIDTFLVQDNAELQYDSLVQKLNLEQVDTARINLLNKISWNYAPTNFEKSKKYGELALELSRQIGWMKGEAFALKNIGEALRYNGKVKESLVEHQMSLKIFRKLSDENNIAALLCNIGISYSRLSDFRNSFEYYNEALKIFTTLANTQGIIKVQTYFGILFYLFKDHEKSLEYYKKALENANKIKLETCIASLLGNIGIVYTELENYSEALVYLKRALGKFKELNDTYNYSIFLGNISDIYMKENLYTKALLYSNNALKFAKKIGNKYGIAYQSGHLGRIQFRMAKSLNNKYSIIERDKLFISSIKDLAEAAYLFDELGHKRAQFEILIDLSNSYKESGQYKQAFNTLEMAQLLKDSLYNIETNNAIADLEFQKNIDIKEKEIEILNKEKEYHLLVKEILLGLAFFLIVVSIVIYLLYDSKRKHNRTLEDNIRIRKEAEETLRSNEQELKKHKGNLEILVDKRTFDLEREILERKKTEKDLLVAIHKSESSNKAKTIFLENMSHELRTPLVGILGYSDLLSFEVQDPDLKEMAMGINRTGNRLLNTVSMVLDLARIESDRFEINITQVNVFEELTEIYNNFKGALASSSIEFKLKLTDEIKIFDTDKGMLKVIVENLVNNAIKFTEKGEIVIESKVEKLQNNSFFSISISDTGIGIREEDISSIFDKFKQLSEGTLKDFPGSGLGLSISKKFIGHLNGKLIVTSKFGAGSTFSLRFPL